MLLLLLFFDHASFLELNPLSLTFLGLFLLGHLETNDTAVVV
jgi:hypothetical protein